MIVTGDKVRMLSVVQCIRDVGQVNIAIAVCNRHFGAINERRMPAQRFTCTGFCHPQPQVAESGFRPLPVKVHLHPVAPLPVQMGIDIVLPATLNPCRKRARDDRARDFCRSETVTFAVRHSPC